MLRYQQKKLDEQIKDNVDIRSFVVNEKTGDLIQKEDIPTPYILLDGIDNFRENVFWINLKNLWILVGKVPPLGIEMDDIVLFKEKGKWGLFRFVEKSGDFVILTDGFRRKKTKVRDENLSGLNMLGKVLRVQKRL